MKLNSAIIIKNISNTTFIDFKFHCVQPVCLIIKINIAHTEIKVVSKDLTSTTSSSTKHF